MIPAKFNRKVGPFPVWVYGVLVGGVLVVYLYVRKKNQSTDTSANTTDSQDTTTTDVLPTDSGVGFPSYVGNGSPYNGYDGSGIGSNFSADDVDRIVDAINAAAQGTTASNTPSGTTPADGGDSPTTPADPGANGAGGGNTGAGPPQAPPPVNAQPSLPPTTFNPNPTHLFMPTVTGPSMKPGTKPILPPFGGKPATKPAPKPPAKKPVGKPPKK